MSSPERAKVGSLVRSGRLSRRWTQEQLAARAHVSRSMIAMVETASASASVDTLARIALALDGELAVELRLPTVIGRTDQVDAAHARCVAAARRSLERRGYVCAVECEIVDGRPRGWIDLLAFDPASGRLLIVEVKTELRDVGGLQRQVGWYKRAGPTVAGAFGWTVQATVVVVVFLATDANDAALVANRDTLAAAFPLRGRAVRDLLVERVVPIHHPGWGLVMIDPRRRGDRVWAASRLDGRRTPAPYRSYADFMEAVRGR
jgi:transcriptional regulator with XRE-family HTH domain